MRSPLVYEVTGLVDDKVEIVNATRLLLYRTALDNAVVSERMMQHAIHTEANYEVIDELLDIAEDEEGNILIQTSLEGLPDKEDFTWQSLQELHEDVHDALQKLFDKIEKEEISQEG